MHSVFIHQTSSAQWTMPPCLWSYNRYIKTLLVQYWVPLIPQCNVREKQFVIEPLSHLFSSLDDAFLARPVRAVNCVRVIDCFFFVLRTGQSSRASQFIRVLSFLDHRATNGRKCECVCACSVGSSKFPLHIRGKIMPTKTTAVTGIVGSYGPLFFLCFEINPFACLPFFCDEFAPLIAHILILRSRYNVCAHRHKIRTHIFPVWLVGNLV